MNGAVIHCVAGDGAGIITGMVIARAAGMSFWQEFWFEYAVGFAIGWLIFQRKSMTMMTDSLPTQLAMAFRSEFFSMLTVMGGMGAVMTYVTPMVVGSQPKPSTFAFWGFAMLGLLVGYVFTYPMNWMLVKVGWKHGMGSMEGGEEKQVERTPKKAAVFAAMAVLGGFALFVPAWLTHAREERSRSGPMLEAAAVNPGFALYEGIHASIERAIHGLTRGDRTKAAQAMDAAMRAADAGAHSAPGEFSSALEQIRAARVSLQQSNERVAVRHLANAAIIVQPAEHAKPPFLDPPRYRGAEVIDAEGATLGEVASVSDGSFELALGGWRDVWGIFDLGATERLRVPVSDLAFGPPRDIGARVVVLPTERDQLASL